MCTVIAAMTALSGAVHAAGIATILDVVNEGYRTPPGAGETNAKPSDELVQDEALRTEEESTIQVKFVDGSELSVESASEVVLSDYVFDGTAATGMINLNDGLFHFTSNGNNDQGVKLRTPVATIGIRGTEFLVHVDSGGATVIDILSGAVEATPLGAGQAVICYEGQSILIASPDETAMCGDIGSFTTAAGEPDGGNDRPEPGNGDQKRGSVPEKVAPPEPPEPPTEDPPTEDPPTENCDGPCPTDETGNLRLFDNEPLSDGTSEPAAGGLGGGDTK
jgi:hypothetical protein